MGGSERWEGWGRKEFFGWKFGECQIHWNGKHSVKIWDLWMAWMDRHKGRWLVSISSWVSFPRLPSVKCSNYNFWFFSWHMIWRDYIDWRDGEAISSGKEEFSFFSQTGRKSLSPTWYSLMTFIKREPSYWKNMSQAKCVNLSRVEFKCSLVLLVYFKLKPGSTEFNSS